MMSPKKLHLEPSSSMSSSDISIISKKMESMSMTDNVRVLRHNKRVQQSRYSSYTTLSLSRAKEKQKQKEEAVPLGVELSLVVAEAMFIFSDDIRTMLFFCMFLFRNAAKKITFDSPVLGKLLCVFEYVFATYIKPKHGVYNDGGMLIHKELIKTSSQSLDSAIRILDRIVLILRDGNLVILSAFVHFNQNLKKQVEKFMSFKDVSEANGFRREAIESKIIDLWKSLFETTPDQVVNTNSRFPHEMFEPLLNEFNQLSFLYSYKTSSRFVLL